MGNAAAQRTEWRNCTPRFVLLPEKGNENKSFPRVNVELTTVTVRRYAAVSQRLTMSIINMLNTVCMLHIKILSLFLSKMQKSIRNRYN